MNGNPEQTQAGPGPVPELFRAVLTPHRSLSAEGFRILMIILGGIGFSTGTLFMALGAWPVLAFFGLGRDPAPTGPYAGGALAQALDDQLAATQRPDAPVRVLLSFRDAGGRFCRGFSGASESGIACRDSAGWRLEKRFGGTERAATEYRQAGNEAADVLAAAQDMAAGPALDAPGEAAAAKRGWQ